MARDFKDFLINSRWQHYQKQLEDSIKIKNKYNNRHSDSIFWTKNEYGCRDHHCYILDMQYCRYMYNLSYLDFKNNTKIRSKKYQKPQIREDLWFKVSSCDLINISGDYDVKIEKDQFIFQPKLNYSLYLNNIPVKYIIMSFRNTTNKNCNDCIKLDFTFDLTIYCDMIDYVLKSAKYKYILFRYLPMEIIDYILYLTSIC